MIFQYTNISIHWIDKKITKYFWSIVIEKYKGIRISLWFQSTIV